MYPFHTHYHGDTLFPEYGQAIPGENDIKVSYVLEDREIFDRMKTLITPLSSYEDTGDDDYNELSDEDYVNGQFLMTVVSFCHKLFKPHLKSLKKSKKELVVHLYKGSGSRAILDYGSIQALNDPIHIYLPSRLVMLLLKRREQRIYIEPELLLSPEVDLLLGLDFKMWPWRSKLNSQEGLISDFWKDFLVTYRLAGLSRLIHLVEGVNTESNSRLLTLGLEDQLQSLLHLLERPDIDNQELNQFSKDEVGRLLLFAPQMMLHAIGVQIHKYDIQDGPSNWKSFYRRYGSGSSFVPKEFFFLYSIGRNMDLEDWFGNLMEPAFNNPPILSKNLVQAIHRKILVIEGRPSIWEEIQKQEMTKLEESFKLKLAEGCDPLSFDGIDFGFSLGLDERVQVLLEKYA